jgi:homopolymeric O-antigen transport system permease protein
MHENPAIAMNEVLLEPPRGWLNLRLREAWEYRELLFFFVWRDIKVRYRQTLLGAAWAVIQPLVTMVIFSVVFGRLAKLPSDGLPYPVFSFAALLPWELFSRALSDASGSLVNNQQLVTKIYFPKIFLPVSSILGGLVDFAISLVILFGMMWYYGIPLTWRILVLPILILFALATALAVAMWLGSFNVRYRDVKYVLPFLTQIWLYASPVAYSSTLIPKQWRGLYGLNPMAGVVEGFRWALLGTQTTTGPMIGVSVLVVVVLLVAGLIYFQRMERTFADIV